MFRIVIAVENGNTIHRHLQFNPMGIAVKTHRSPSPNGFGEVSAAKGATAPVFVPTLGLRIVRCLEGERMGSTIKVQSNSSRSPDRKNLTTWSSSSSFALA